MGKANTHGKMADATKANTTMIRNMGMACTLGLIRGGIKVTGKMVRDKEKAGMCCPVESAEMVSGIKIRELSGLHRVKNKRKQEFKNLMMLLKSTVKYIGSQL